EAGVLLKLLGMAEGLGELVDDMALLRGQLIGVPGIDGGEITVEQRAKPNDLAKRMAVVFSDALRPDLMTCREAVAVGRYPYTGRFGRLSADDERIVENAMAQVHVTELADRPFNAISDGQRQRVVLARALCQEPDIILLDEPTTFLDIRWKAEFLEALRTLATEQGKTVLLTLHEPELARLVSDRVACIRDGRLDRVGTPDEVFEGDYIANLFGLNKALYDRWFT
ncbi:MAG: ABC transporter ATP-binding protein, partial [Clostridia bacterium]|nr:ABC transporter ATP-binding protein [Clostridia bacterium]